MEWKIKRHDATVSDAIAKRMTPRLLIGQSTLRSGRIRPWIQSTAHLQYGHARIRTTPTFWQLSKHLSCPSHSYSKSGGCCYRHGHRGVQVYGKGGQQRACSSPQWMTTEFHKPVNSDAVARGRWWMSVHLHRVPSMFVRVRRRNHAVIHPRPSAIQWRRSPAGWLDILSTHRTYCFV